MSTYSFTGNKVSFTYQRLLQISDGGDGNPTGIIYDGYGATVTIANENINNLYTTVNNLINNGIAGSTGSTGVQGWQGPIGLTGESVTGAQGLDGPTGFQGNTGDQGYQGPIGLTGIGKTGSQGDTGPQGFQGNTGPQGVGSTGLQGNTGSQGDTGPQGFQGITGPQGAGGGVTGSQGNTGVQGDTGPTGYQGNTGPQGFQGAGGGSTGNQGDTGPQGDIGTQGSTGPQGETGPQGFQGDLGPQGFQGNTGSQGNTGTQGFQGSIGSQGSTGSQGFQGSIGPQGFQGNIGSQGQVGQSTQFFNYIAITSSTVDSYVTASYIEDGYTGFTGYIIWNNSTQISATALSVSHIDEIGNDIDIFLNLISSGDKLIIQDRNNSNSYQQWLVSSSLNTVANNYVEIPVSLITATGLGYTNFPNQHEVILVISSVGATGPQGFQGDIGPQGDLGPQGFQGAQGETGPQGDIGPQGDLGPQGFQGAQGETGPQGDLGPQGVTGPQGDLGPQGITGPQGSTGSQGLTGPQGFTGPQGITGPQGSTGSQGLTGPQGNYSPFYFQDTAPSTSLPIGSRWLDSSTGEELVLVNDGGSIQWVQPYNGGGGGGAGGAGTPGTTGPQGDIGPQGSAGSGSSNSTRILSGLDPDVISGMTSSGTYRINGPVYDGYRINANINVPGGTNVYINYIGTVTITGATFTPHLTRGIVVSDDPGGFFKVQSSLTSGSLVYDETLGFAAPVDLMTVNYDNTTSANDYDIFFISGNTNNFSCNVFVDYEFYVDKGDIISFSN